MKVYVTTRFKGADNKQGIETLCAAVRAAKMRDFSFVRDVENYKKTFDNPKDLWARAFDEIGACDALLVDVSDRPAGGRLVEAGMAYALRKPVIVTKRHGIDHKPLFDGIAATVITYKDHADLTRQLIKYDKERSFNMTDRGTLLVMFLLVGGVIAWFLSQLFIPLALVGAIVYWLLVRKFFPLMRAFDRVVVYIPLAAIWVSGYFLLEPVYLPLAWAWLMSYWVVVLFVLKKLKFSL